MLLATLVAGLGVAAAAAGLAAATAGARPARVAARASTPRHWAMPRRLTWYWQLQGTINTARPAAAYDVDGFGTSAAEVARLHAARKHVICYIDVGTWENWRPDAHGFPSSVLGNNNGWPGERWLDIRALSVLEPIMTARLAICARRHFDAVEPDNIDQVGNDRASR